MDLKEGRFKRKRFKGVLNGGFLYIEGVQVVQCIEAARCVQWIMFISLICMHIAFLPYYL